MGYVITTGDSLNVELPITMKTYSPVTISLFPTSIDLDPIFEKDRDLDRFRSS